MRIRIVSLGTNWWSAHSPNVADPFCLRRTAAWFNSAGLKFGNRLRLCWVYPGHIRFNQTSGFNPEFPLRTLGKSFECSGPNRVDGRSHILFARPAAQESEPDQYLVTFAERLCGPIHFNRPNWKSDDVQLVSASVRRDRYEVMALIDQHSWIASSLGFWSLSQDRTRLVLADCGDRG